MTQTVQEFFASLASRADTSKTAGMTNSYLFDIEGAGEWHVDVDDGTVEVREGGATRTSRSVPRRRPFSASSLASRTRPAPT